MLNKGNAAPITAAVESLALSGGETVADIGFGGGFGLGVLLDATGDGGRVHGVEPAADMVARAGRARRADLASGRLELHEASMEALPFPDGALDGWISVNTIYFVDDLAAAFREMTRVLAPGGRGVVGIADPEWMSHQAFTRHGFTLRPVADVLTALGATGLTPEHHPLGDREPVFHLLTGVR
jgi:ubiquinone/menaquinone biosynthesis C-methylase UbiE